MRTRAAVAALLAAVVVRSGRAHEHMYVGSTAKNGGALALDYAFARHFPLAELANQPDTWIGVDPSFNSLVDDDPTRSLYRLKTGTKVTMEIVAVDPAVSVLLNTRTLAAAGDRATVGRMPYLHVHPQWTLVLPVGTFGEANVAFRVRASGYDASPVYAGVLDAAPPPPTTTTTTASTTTTTYEGETTTSTTSTTTTLPPCTAASCDDVDPCTDDVCADATTCTHLTAVAAAAVLCRLRGFQAVLDHEPPVTKPGRRTLAKLYKALTQAREAIQTARAKDTPKRFKVAGKRISRLTTMVDAADRGGALTADGLDSLRSLASSAYDAFALWERTNP